jgi:hypothetical protein
MRRDLDDILQSWPFDPGSGEVIAREVTSRNRRRVVQVRVELGVLQMEVEGRPDGQRPHGFPTYLDFLRSRVKSPGRKSNPGWKMDPEHCAEADREFIQYYHRRVAWLALQKFEKALIDADHTLAMMDFVARHGMNEEYIQTHERLRGLVLFHRTQAAAALALEGQKPDEAVDAIRDGIARLTRTDGRWAIENEEEGGPEIPLVEQLRHIEREIRKHFLVPKTLREQLDEAVQREDYERAARLRDEIKARAAR